MSNCYAVDVDMRAVAEAIKDYKHICWYPSSGEDFKPLLFLSDWYYKKNNVPMDEGQITPDLFIFTYYAGFHSHDTELRGYGDAYEQIQNGYCEPGSSFIHVSYKNSSTDIIVKSFEKLRDLQLSFDTELAAFEKGPDYNSAFLMKVEVISRINEKVNTYETSIMYVAALNEMFAERVLIPNRIKTEYLIIIRYGTGFGGGNGKGFTWILSDYKELGIKYLVTSHCVQSEFSETESDKPYPNITGLYGIDGKQWTKDVPVVWYKLT